MTERILETVRNADGVYEVFDGPGSHVARMVEVVEQFEGMAEGIGNAIETAATLRDRIRAAIRGGHPRRRIVRAEDL